MFPILSHFSLVKNACISIFDVAAWHISVRWSPSSSGRVVTAGPVAQHANTDSGSGLAAYVLLSSLRDTHTSCDPTQQSCCSQSGIS